VLAMLNGQDNILSDDLRGDLDFGSVHRLSGASVVECDFLAYPPSRYGS
jgi:hypothetical protein